MDGLQSHCRSHLVKDCVAFRRDTVHACAPERCSAQARATNLTALTA
ncbi:hypothetical protein [Candidatus Nitrospira salsa]